MIRRRFNAEKVMENIPGVVGKDGGIASAEVKGSRVTVADEDGRLSVALVEVKPLLSLNYL